MATLLLDSLGDLDISSGTVTVTTDIATEYKQKMYARLNAVKGEWRYDLGRGLPYFERIFVKNPRLAEVQDIYRKACMSVPGTLSVSFKNFSFSGVTRVLSFSFEALTDFQTTTLNFNVSFDLYKDTV